MVLLYLALTCYVSRYWMWLTAFIGLNRLQSAFTNWCPAMLIVRSLGLAEVSCSLPREKQHVG